MGILSEKEIRRLIRINMTAFKEPINEGRTISTSDRESFKVVKKPKYKKLDRKKGETDKELLARANKELPYGQKYASDEVEKLKGKSFAELRYDGRVAEHYLGPMDPILVDIVSNFRRGKWKSNDDGIKDLKAYLERCRVKARITITTPRGKKKKKDYKFPISPEGIEADKSGYITNPKFLESIYQNYLNFGIAAKDYNTEKGKEFRTTGPGAGLLDDFSNYDYQNTEYVIKYMSASDAESRLEKMSRQEVGGKTETDEEYAKRIGGRVEGGKVVKPKSYLVRRSELKKFAKDPKVAAVIAEIEGFEERYRAEPHGYEIIYFDKGESKIDTNPKPPEPKNPKGTVITLKDIKVKVPSDSADGVTKIVRVPVVKVGMADFFAEVYNDKILLAKDVKPKGTVDETRLKNMIRALHGLLKLTKVGKFDGSNLSFQNEENYGQDTHDAVEAFQKAKKKTGGVYGTMTIDGKVGKQTINALDKGMQGKLVPISGSEYEYTADEVKKLGLPTIGNSHKPKLYQQGNDLSKYEGPHTANDQSFIARITLAALKSQNAPAGTYKLFGKGKRIDPKGGWRQGAEGNITYVGGGGSEDKFTPAMKEYVEKLIFRPEVDGEGGKEMIKTVVLKRGGKKGETPRWTMVLEYIPEEENKSNT